MTAIELINKLSKYPPNTHIVLDLDDFSSFNPQDLTNIYSILTENRGEVIVLDADWGKMKDNNLIYIVRPEVEKA